MNLHQLASEICIVEWRLRQTVRRYREAIAYARNRLGMTLANDIIYNCQAAAGWYPLETLSVDSCLRTARDVHWNDHPELESLVQSACARVASKWESTGHAADAAEDWALDLIPEYASARGITLTRLEDDLAEDPAATSELTSSPAEIVPDKPG
jgi:hypothetical protein